jgi:hypothetical protein
MTEQAAGKKVEIPDYMVDGQPFHASHVIALAQRHMREENWWPAPGDSIPQYLRKRGHVVIRGHEHAAALAGEEPREII